MKTPIAAAVLALAAAVAAPAHAVTFDFTGSTNGATGSKSFSSGGVNLTASGGSTRMANTPDTGFLAASVFQGVGGLGVASANDWDPLFLGAGGFSVTWTFTGAGETLFLTFDQKVTLNNVTLLFPLGGQLWPTTTAFAYSLDNGQKSSQTALNSWFSQGTLNGLGTQTFNTSGLNASKTFAISGVIGLDHIDTTVVLSKIDVTPVPEASTYAMMLAGLGAIGFVARRRKQA